MHRAARRQRRDRVETLQRLEQRLRRIGHPRDLEHGRGLRQQAPRPLPQTLDQHGPEPLGGHRAQLLERARHHLADGIEHVSGVAGLGERRERDPKQLRQVRAGALLDEERQGVHETHEPVVLLVLHELERRLLQPRVAPLLREPFQQLGEHGAALGSASRFAQPDREREAHVQIIGDDRPRALQRLDALRV